MKRRSPSKQGWVVTTAEVNERFRIDYRESRVKPWPAIAIVDGSTEETLCNIRRARDFYGDRPVWKYLGETPDDQNLFESANNPFWAYKKGPLVMSVNQTDGSTMQVHAESRYTYRVKPRLTVNDARIAFVKKQPWTARREYHVHMSPGVDPLLVISMAVIMDHQCSIANLFLSAAVGGGVGVVTGVVVGPFGLLPGLLSLVMNAGALKTAGLPDGRRRRASQIPQELNKAKLVYKGRRYV